MDDHQMSRNMAVLLLTISQNVSSREDNYHSVNNAIKQVESLEQKGMNCWPVDSHATQPEPMFEDDTSAHTNHNNGRNNRSGHRGSRRGNRQHSSQQYQ